jgi:hypothetical protein
MTELTSVDPPRATDQVKRDRYGRYLLPHPETGKEQTWTRATTIANTLADRYGLEQWAKRNVALGIGARRDLYAQAAAAKPDDKATLTRIVEQAEEAASSKAGANLGSALHRFTERIDAGEDITVPEPWVQDVAAYTQTMQANGLVVVPGWIERILLVPEIEAAGTCDRLTHTPRPDVRTSYQIADLKTGQDVVKYGMTEIALQLAIYAHATHWYDPITRELNEMPAVDQQAALVMHLPVGQGRCTIYEVDICSGWEAVQLAMQVRRWRTRKDLAQIINVPAAKPTQAPIDPEVAAATHNLRLAATFGLEIPEELPGADQQRTDEQAYLDLLDRIEWVRERVQHIKAEGYGTALALEWSKYPDVPTFPKGGPTTNQHVTVIAQMCDWVEAEYGIPFGASDPTIKEQTKTQRKTHT